MSLFYKGFIAIFVTIFSWIGPVSATPKATPVPQGACESKLARPHHTKIIQMAIQDPVGLYFELYNRDLNYHGEKPHDFPVRDLFEEDLKILRNDLRTAQETFKARNLQPHLRITTKMLRRANAMLRTDFGYMSYCEFTRAWVRIMNLRNPELTDLGYILKMAATVDGYFRGEIEAMAIYSYHQFPQYALPSVSNTDRMDIILMSSAPLTIRRLAIETENVDGRDLRPTSNEDHDRDHALRLALILHFASFAKRFQNADELRTHISQKFAASQYIVQKIKGTQGVVEQLRLDQMLYHYAHEETYASIEYFGENYGGVLFSGGALFPNGVPESFFLNRKEIQRLKSEGKPPGTHERIVNTLKQWYQEGWWSKTSIS